MAWSLYWKLGNIVWPYKGKCFLFILCSVEFTSRRDLLIIESMYQHDSNLPSFIRDAILKATSNTFIKNYKVVDKNHWK